MPKNPSEDHDFGTGSGKDPETFELTPEKEPLLTKLRSFGWTDFVNRNKIPILLALLGLILVGLGAFIFRNTDLLQKDRIEVVSEATEGQSASSKIVVDIAGSVEKPGVYELDNDSRIEDLLIASGGLSAKADRDWVEKYVNRASKLSDGQKIYIRSINEKQETINNNQSQEVSAKNDGGYQSASPILGLESGGLTNINTASFEELDKLPGIGQVYGRKIIEQRPYSNTTELQTRQILPKSTYEKIKDKITVY